MTDLESIDHRYMRPEYNQEIELNIREGELIVWGKEIQIGEDTYTQEPIAVFRIKKKNNTAYRFHGSRHIRKNILGYDTP